MATPFSAAADRNKEAIGDALAPYLATGSDEINVLEIGSGTGQHANYLSNRFAHLNWQMTDRQQSIDALNKMCSSTSHLMAPVELEVSACEKDPGLLSGLSHQQYPFIYSSNTAHIMSVEEVGSMFSIVGKLLSTNGIFALYGPFKIDDEHTSESNRQFDQSLRLEKPHMGIRDKGELKRLASSLGLRLYQDIPMPANNRLLLWQQSDNPGAS